MTKEIAGLPIALPRSRSVWAATVAIFLLCFIVYYFYSGWLSLGLLVSIILGILYYAQDGLLYHPELPVGSRIYVPIPTMHNLPYEAVNIRTPDKVTLHGFWVYQPDERSKTVPTFVYFHGNAGNIGHRMQNVWGIFNNLHCNILMVEYRGYGFSTGMPSERGFCIDARAALDYLYTRDDLDHTQIVLFGRSLGGAVVIDVAADTIYSQKIMCAIVENTFTRISSMAWYLLHPSFKYVPNICYKNKYNSLSKVGKCSVPFLFISGLADNLVPPYMVRALFRKCGSERKRILEFVGGGHNDTWLVDGYYQGIKTFLDECQNVTPPLQKPPEKSNVWHEIQDV